MQRTRKINPSENTHSGCSAPTRDTHHHPDITSMMRIAGPDLHDVAESSPPVHTQTHTNPLYTQTQVQLKQS